MKYNQHSAGTMYNHDSNQMEYDGSEYNKMNPYKPGTAGYAMEACYNACSTCCYSKDHRMMLQCCNPHRDMLEVHCIGTLAQGENPYRKLQKGSNYCVDPNEWCKYFEAQDMKNNPELYSTGGTSTGSVGSAT